MSAIIVAGAIVGIVSSENASNAAENAAASQSESNQAALDQQSAQFEAAQALQMQIAEMQMAMQEGIANRQIEEAQRQFNMVQQVLAPFVTAGNQALGPLQQYQQTGLDALAGQRNIAGLNGTEAQQAAIRGLSQSPEMAAYMQQGEDAILGNASATGGLRGGNAQAALGQFRPALLANMISAQYERLGGLTSLGANTSSMLYQSGQSAAAGVGSAGMQVAGQVGSALAGYSQGVGSAYGQLANASAANSANMANAYGQYYQNQGAISAGNILGQANAQNMFYGGVSNALGSYAALQAMRGSNNPNTMQLTGVSSAGGTPTATYSF